MVSAPGSAFVSKIAARSVQTPLPGSVSHTPSPALASRPSAVVLRVNVVLAYVGGVPPRILIASKTAKKPVRIGLCFILRPLIPLHATRLSAYKGAVGRNWRIGG